MYWNMKVGKSYVRPCSLSLPQGGALVLSLSLSLFPMDHSHQPSLHCTNFFIFFSLFADRASQDT